MGKSWKTRSKEIKMEWINVKDRLPNFGEFVEVIYPDKSRLTDVCRDFAAYLCDDTGCFWVSADMDERDWSDKGYQIKHWRPMAPDTRGRKPYLKVDRRGYFSVYKKKVV
jgi:hypothetical protein